jgi:hypothetical protein
MKERLINGLLKIQREIEAAEEVLNDGIEYDKEFVNELHDHVKTQIINLIRVKGILVNRYGVVAV